jgi:hypothetical protein
MVTELSEHTKGGTMPRMSHPAAPDVTSPTRVGNRLFPEEDRPALEVIRFGDFLVERKAIDRQQLFVAIDHHLRKGCRLGEAVVYFGYLEPEELETVAAEYHALAAVEV